MYIHRSVNENLYGADASDIKQNYIDCQLCDVYIPEVYSPYASTLNNNSFAKFRWNEMKWKSRRAHWLLSRLEHTSSTKEESTAGKRKYGNEVLPEIKHRRAVRPNGGDSPANAVRSSIRNSAVRFNGATLYIRTISSRRVVRRSTTIRNIQRLMNN